MFFHAKDRNYSDKKFPCNWKKCGASFKSNSQLQDHLKTHKNDLSECVFCPYRTSQVAHLQDHYRLHFKMFDLKCNFCDKKFVSRSFLNAHHLTHSKDTYTCQICKQYTGTRTTLQRHIGRVHKLSSKWNETKQSFETFIRE